MKIKIRFYVPIFFALFLFGAASTNQTDVTRQSAEEKTEEAPIIPQAEALFTEVSKLITENYVDPNLTQDELWTGAIQGMLERLIQTEDLRVNELLDPHDLEEMELGIKGQFTGIGIVIKKMKDVVFIPEVIPGGAAESAGIQDGDRILSIDGKSVKEMPLFEIVQMIRGPENTNVSLLIQREAAEWSVDVTRKLIKVEQVFGDLLDEETAYIKIASFANNTLETFDRMISEYLTKGAKRLILDLRDCPGGLLEVSISLSERFLSKGERILSVKRRSGEETVYEAEAEGKYNLPIVVLINHKTASSGEILAAALAENDRAILVGETSFGKGTVEQIFKLSNGWGIKLSIAHFYSPKGHNWQGKGIEPHFTIPASEKDEEEGYSAKAKIDLSGDAQLKTAIHVLRLIKK